MGAPFRPIHVVAVGPVALPGGEWENVEEERKANIIERARAVIFNTSRMTRQAWPGCAHNSLESLIPSCVKGCIDCALDFWRYRESPHYVGGYWGRRNAHQSMLLRPPLGRASVDFDMHMEIKERLFQPLVAQIYLMRTWAPSSTSN